MTQYIGNVPEGAKYEVFDMSTNYNGNRNIIINGDMRINQRGVTSKTATNWALDYVADRFFFYNGNSGTVTISHSTDVPAASEHVFPFSNKMQCLTTDASMDASEESGVGYSVEGYDVAPYQGKTLTLSFWVKRNQTGTFPVSFRNSANDRSYITTYTVYTADTWEYKSVQLPLTETGGTWDWEEGAGIKVYWTLDWNSAEEATALNTWEAGNKTAHSSLTKGFMSSTSNYINLTGVQLEVGETATTFEVSTYADQLARCQRYYQTIYVPTYSTLGSGRGMGTTTTYTPVLQLRTVMRTTPTGNTSTSGDIQIKRISDNTSLSSTENISIIGVDNTSYRWGMTYTHSSPDETYRLNTTASAFTGTLSAEL